MISDDLVREVAATRFLMLSERLKKLEADISQRSHEHSRDHQIMQREIDALKAEIASSMKQHVGQESIK